MQAGGQHKIGTDDRQDTNHTFEEEIQRTQNDHNQNKSAKSVCKRNFC